jgi:hypothetical protein
MCEKVPIKNFVYPGGQRMCLDGLVRAAYTGNRILKCEITPEDIEIMARKGRIAIENSADTNKRNLIYFAVYRHAYCGNLTEYVNLEGDFLLNNMTISNIFLPRHEIILNNLKKTGILLDK